MMLLLPSHSGQPRLLHQRVRSDRLPSRHGRLDPRRIKILQDGLVNARPHRRQEQRVLRHLPGGRHQDDPANLHRLVRGLVLRARVGQFSVPTGLAVRHPSLAMVNGREHLESPAKPGPSVPPLAIRIAAQCRLTSLRRRSGFRLAVLSSRQRLSSRPGQQMRRQMVERHLLIHLIRLGPQEPREIPGHAKGRANATLLGRAFSHHRPSILQQAAGQLADQPIEIAQGLQEAWLELSRLHGSSLSERSTLKRDSIQIRIRTILTSTT